MLSFCIPTYCYDVRKLIVTLYQQLQLTGVPFEIIVIDDGSPVEWQRINDSIREKANYIILPKNIGRSAIRNLFLRYSRYEWMLFLDSDVMPAHDYFVQNYIEAIRQNGELGVICGGLIMPPPPENKSQRLRWYYGTKRECRPIEIRRQHPYQSFMTGNFCVRKSVLSQLPFDETLSRYGHEDTLFGYRLMQNKIPLQHIDNPVVHLHMEEAKVFIEKTEIAVANLYRIASDLLQDDTAFISQNRLLSSAYRIKKLRLLGLFRSIFFVCKPIIRWCLIHIRPRWLMLFDIYKLGILSRMMP